MSLGRFFPSIFKRGKLQKPYVSGKSVMSAVPYAPNKFLQMRIVKPHYNITEYHRHYLGIPVTLLLNFVVWGPLCLMYVCLPLTLPSVSYRTSYIFWSSFPSLNNQKLQVRNRARVTSNGQRYPLPCRTHFGNLKCAQQGKGYCWPLLALGRLF